ncbi:hypothetical protein LXL04_006556 [Taraxacum kok-saghyz]
MNTKSEETREDGKQRRKSIGTPNGGQGGGLTVSGGKTRRYSVGIPSSRKTILEDEGTIVPNYLRASTGSCHDFCKYGKKHEHSKSAIPVKFKRSTAVNKDKVIPLEKNPKIELTKKNVALPSKKPEIVKRVLSKPKENEVKSGQRAISQNGGVKKKDIETVKKKGICIITPKDVKKTVVVKSQSPKASSFSKVAKLKAIKYKNVEKQVSPLKDQNRVLKTDVKEIVSESEGKSEGIEFDYIQESVGIDDSSSFLSKELMKEYVLRNGSEKESVITHESSKVFQEEKVFEEDSSMAGGILKKSQSFSEVLDEDSLIAPPVSESSQSFYDDEDFTDEEEEDEYESSDIGKDGKINATEENNIKIARKGRKVISEEKDDEGVKLRFRRGKILDLESVNNNGPRRLKFRKGKVMEGNEGIQHVSRRSFEKKYEKERNGDSVNNGGHESVVLKHQGEKEKKDAQGLFNNVIEETASKLVETRKSKVKALVGAFETVISLQDGKP